MNSTFGVQGTWGFPEIRGPSPHKKGPSILGFVFGPLMLGYVGLLYIRSRWFWVDVLHLGNWTLRDTAQYYYPYPNTDPVRLSQGRFGAIWASLGVGGGTWLGVVRGSMMKESPRSLQFLQKKPGSWNTTGPLISKPKKGRRKRSTNHPTSRFQRFSLYCKRL